MNIEKMREEFEKWVNAQEWCIDLLWRDGYIAWEAQFAFDAWRASRAAIEVELPDPWFYPLAKFNLIAQDLTIKAIESLGLKVKS